ncbi:hypothetical protein B6U83_01080 [Thermoplasmatales archaeon ex4484_36]|nr:MAG: hypothetical protein B6U83_01080 [Thermoplasmatales archaeon ex4484_36]
MKTGGRKGKGPEKGKGAPRKKLPKVDYSNIKWRINVPFRPPKRVKTGLRSVDKYFGGGLPKGLTVLVGGAGSGKTKLAQSIAKYGDFEKVYYFTCEVSSDAPDRNEFEHVDRIDYTMYRPKWDRAVAELKAFVEHDEPDLVVIDSLSSFLSGSTKALAESDIREGVSIIHMTFDGVVPIIGISEIRGSGFSETPAGGRGVEHSCNLLVYMENMYVKFKGQEIYGEIGEHVWLSRVLKDKQGLASSDECRVVYRNDKPYFIKVRR